MLSLDRFRELAGTTAGVVPARVVVRGGLFSRSRSVEVTSAKRLTDRSVRDLTGTQDVSTRRLMEEARSIDNPGFIDRWQNRNAIAEFKRAIRNYVHNEFHRNSLSESRCNQDLEDAVFRPILAERERSGKALTPEIVRQALEAVGDEFARKNNAVMAVAREHVPELVDQYLKRFESLRGEEAPGRASLPDRQALIDQCLKRVEQEIRKGVVGKDWFKNGLVGKLTREVLDAEVKQLTDQTRERLQKLDDLKTVHGSRFYKDTVASSLDRQAFLEARETLAPALVWAERVNELVKEALEANPEGQAAVLWKVLAAQHQLERLDLAKIAELANTGKVDGQWCHESVQLAAKELNEDLRCLGGWLRSQSALLPERLPNAQGASINGIREEAWKAYHDQVAAQARTVITKFGGLRHCDSKAIERYLQEQMTDCYRPDDGQPVTAGRGTGAFTISKESTDNGVYRLVLNIDQKAYVLSIDAGGAKVSPDLAEGAVVNPNESLPEDAPAYLRLVQELYEGGVREGLQKAYDAISSTTYLLVTEDSGGENRNLELVGNTAIAIDRLRSAIEQLDAQYRGKKGHLAETVGNLKNQIQGRIALLETNYLHYAALKVLEAEANAAPGSEVREAFICRIEQLKLATRNELRAAIAHAPYTSELDFGKDLGATMVKYSRELAQAVKWACILSADNQEFKGRVAVIREEYSRLTLVASLSPNGPALPKVLDDYRAKLANAFMAAGENAARVGPVPQPRHGLAGLFFFEKTEQWTWTEYQDNFTQGPLAEKISEASNVVRAGWPAHLATVLEQYFHDYPAVLGLDESLMVGYLNIYFRKNNVIDPNSGDLLVASAAGVGVRGGLVLTKHDGMVTFKLATGAAQPVEIKTLSVYGRAMVAVHAFFHEFPQITLLDVTEIKSRLVSYLKKMNVAPENIDQLITVTKIPRAVVRGAAAQSPPPAPAPLLGAVPPRPGEVVVTSAPAEEHPAQTMIIAAPSAVVAAQHFVRSHTEIIGKTANEIRAELESYFQQVGIDCLPISPGQPVTGGFEVSEVDNNYVVRIYGATRQEQDIITFPKLPESKRAGFALSQYFDDNADLCLFSDEEQKRNAEVEDIKQRLRAREMQLPEGSKFPEYLIYSKAIGPELPPFSMQLENMREWGMEGARDFIRPLVKDIERHDDIGAVLFRDFARGFVYVLGERVLNLSAADVKSPRMTEQHALESIRSYFDHWNTAEWPGRGQAVCQFITARLNQGGLANAGAGILKDVFRIHDLDPEERILQLIRHGEPGGESLTDDQCMILVKEKGACKGLTYPDHIVLFKAGEENKSQVDLQLSVVLNLPRRSGEQFTVASADERFSLNYSPSDIQVVRDTDGQLLETQLYTLDDERELACLGAPALGVRKHSILGSIGHEPAETIDSGVRRIATELVDQCLPRAQIYSPSSQPNAAVISQPMTYANRERLIKLACAKVYVTDSDQTKREKVLKNLEREFLDPTIVLLGRISERLSLAPADVEELSKKSKAGRKDERLCAGALAALREGLEWTSEAERLALDCMRGPDNGGIDDLHFRWYSDAALKRLESLDQQLRLVHEVADDARKPEAERKYHGDISLAAIRLEKKLFYLRDWLRGKLEYSRLVRIASPAETVQPVDQEAALAVRNAVSGNQNVAEALNVAFHNEDRVSQAVNTGAIISRAEAQKTYLAEVTRCAQDLLKNFGGLRHGESRVIAEYLKERLGKAGVGGRALYNPVTGLPISFGTAPGDFSVIKRLANDGVEHLVLSIAGAAGEATEIDLLPDTGLNERMPDDSPQYLQRPYRFYPQQARKDLEELSTRLEGSAHLLAESNVDLLNHEKRDRLLGSTFIAIKALQDALTGIARLHERYDTGPESAYIKESLNNLQRQILGRIALLQTNYSIIAATQALADTTLSPDGVAFEAFIYTLQERKKEANDRIDELLTDEARRGADIVDLEGFKADLEEEQNEFLKDVARAAREAATFELYALKHKSAIGREVIRLRRIAHDKTSIYASGEEARNGIREYRESLRRLVTNYTRSARQPGRTPFYGDYSADLSFPTADTTFNASAIVNKLTEGVGRPAVAEMNRLQRGWPEHVKQLVEEYFIAQPESINDEPAAIEGRLNKYFRQRNATEPFAGDFLRAVERLPTGNANRERRFAIERANDGTLVMRLYGNNGEALGEPMALPRPPAE